MPYIPSHASLEYQLIHRAEYLTKNPFEITEEEYAYLNMNMEIASEVLPSEDISYLRFCVEQVNRMYTMMYNQ